MPQEATGQEKADINLLDVVEKIRQELESGQGTGLFSTPLTLDNSTVGVSGTLAKSLQSNPLTAGVTKPQPQEIPESQGPVQQAQEKDALSSLAEKNPELFSKLDVSPEGTIAQGDALSRAVGDKPFSSTIADVFRGLGKAFSFGPLGMVLNTLGDQVEENSEDAQQFKRRRQFADEFAAGLLSPEESAKQFALIFDRDERRELIKGEGEAGRTTQKEIAVLDREAAADRVQLQADMRAAIETQNVPAQSELAVNDAKLLFASDDADDIKEELTALGDDEELIRAKFAQIISSRNPGVHINALKQASENLTLRYLTAKRTGVDSVLTEQPGSDIFSSMFDFLSTPNFPEKPLLGDPESFATSIFGGEDRIKK